MLLLIARISGRDWTSVRILLGEELIKADAQFHTWLSQRLLHRTAQVPANLAASLPELVANPPPALKCFGGVDGATAASGMDAEGT